MAWLDLGGGRAPGAGPAAKRSRASAITGAAVAVDMRGDQRRQALAAAARARRSWRARNEAPGVSGAPVDRAQQRVDVQQRAPLDAGQQRHPRPPARPRWLALNCGQLVGVAEGETRRKKIPNVDGAYTSSNTRGVPPARSTFDIVDAVRAARHRGDDRGQLAGRIHRPGGHPSRQQVHMLAEQFRKTQPAYADATMLCAKFTTNNMSHQRWRPHELTGRLPRPFAPTCLRPASSSGKPCKVGVRMWGDACPRHAHLDAERIQPV